eukprot:g14188.t1
MCSEEIFCSLDEQELQEILLNAQRRQERNFENIKVTKVHVTPAKATTSMYRLKELPLDSFDQIFILADASQGVDRADEQTVAMVLQMQSILKDRDPEKDRQTQRFVNVHSHVYLIRTWNHLVLPRRTVKSLQDFQPMVEICTNTAQEQLSEIGIQNMINTTLLVSKALAMVAIRRSVREIGVNG